MGRRRLIGWGSMIVIRSGKSTENSPFSKVFGQSKSFFLKLLSKVEVNKLHSLIILETRRSVHKIIKFWKVSIPWGEPFYQDFSPFPECTCFW